MNKTLIYFHILKIEKSCVKRISSYFFMLAIFLFTFYLAYGDENEDAYIYSSIIFISFFLLCIAYNLIKFYFLIKNNSELVYKSILLGDIKKLTLDNGKVNKIGHHFYFRKYIALDRKLYEERRVLIHSFNKKFPKLPFNFRNKSIDAYSKTHVYNGNPFRRDNHKLIFDETFECGYGYRSFEIVGILSEYHKDIDVDAFLSPSQKKKAKKIIPVIVGKIIKKDDVKIDEDRIEVDKDGGKFIFITKHELALFIP